MLTTAQRKEFTKHVMDAEAGALRAALLCVAEVIHAANAAGLNTILTDRRYAVSEEADCVSCGCRADARCPACENPVCLECMPVGSGECEDCRVMACESAV